MLKFLWLRLPSPGPGATDERALARYFRDEGLHAELEGLRPRDESERSSYGRALYNAHSYFAA
jgi:hypothetical protein